MISKKIFLVFLLIFNVSIALADVTKSSNERKEESSSFSKKKLILLKYDDYKKVRKNLMDLGWKSYKNSDLDKSSSEVKSAINLNKSLGFFELQQCFSRGKNLFSCDVTWTSTGNKENPELIFSIVIDAVSKISYIEDDVKSN